MEIDLELLCSDSILFKFTDDITFFIRHHFRVDIYSSVAVDNKLFCSTY